MCDIHNYIPTRPSEQHIGILLSVGIVPIEVLVRVAIAAPSMVTVSGPFNPFFTEVGWLVFVSTVDMLVTVIVSML